MGNEEMLGGLLTVHSRTAFSAGLYDILNTGNLEPLEICIPREEKFRKMKIGKKELLLDFLLI